jgi:hypothetical protein
MERLSRREPGGSGEIEEAISSNPGEKTFSSKIEAIIAFIIGRSREIRLFGKNRGNIFFYTG